MAKVLLHTLVFSPDAVSTAYLMTDLARQLNSLGHSVTVLTTTPHYNLDQRALSRQQMHRRWMGLLYQSTCDGIPVWHVKIPMKGQRVFTRVIDYIYYHAVALLVGSTIVGSYDIVIAPSPPLTIGIVGWLLGVRRNVPFVYNIQEIYPDFAINQGLIRNPLLIKLLRLMEQFVYARSRKLVTISKWFSEIIQRRGVQEQKLCVIPNFVDTELYHPLPRRNSFAENHSLLDSFVILYGGNVGLSQDWESFLFASESLSHLPILFVVVGDGVRNEWLKNEVESRGLHNVKLLGYQSRELMPEINASCDICTIPMKASTTTDTFPSKIYTILACAKPVIVQADANSELSWLITQSRSGRVVSPGDPQAYTDAVLKAFHEKTDLPAEGERGRKFIEQEYSKESVGLKYKNLVDELIVNDWQY